jgi:hypothetical protein
LNEDAGRSQLVLAYLIAHNLMRGRQKMGTGADRFWQELSAMDNSFAEREVLRIKHLPVDIARHLTMPLFDPTLPTVGEHGYVDAPQMLIRSALDAAARVADSLHVKKDELMVTDVMGRLEREVRSLNA